MTPRRESPADRQRRLQREAMARRRARLKEVGGHVDERCRSCGIQETAVRRRVKTSVLDTQGEWIIEVKPVQLVVGPVGFICRRCKGLLDAYPTLPQMHAHQLAICEGCGDRRHVEKAMRIKALMRYMAFVQAWQATNGMTKVPVPTEPYVVQAVDPAAEHPAPPHALRVIHGHGSGHGHSHGDDDEVVDQDDPTRWGTRAHTAAMAAAREAFERDMIMVRGKWYRRDDPTRPLTALEERAGL